jgi:hypothetical protein
MPGDTIDPRILWVEYPINKSGYLLIYWGLYRNYTVSIGGTVFSKQPLMKTIEDKWSNRSASMKSNASHASSGTSDPRPDDRRLIGCQES